MRTGRATVILVCLLAGGLPIAQAWPAEASVPTTPAVETAARERAAFGLGYHPGVVARLLESPADVGTSRWGLPLTEEEETLLDLRGRMAFAHDVSLELLPWVRGLTTYAGAYFDQRDNGALVVLLTERDREVERRIYALRPAVDRGVRVRYVRNTQEQLRVAAARAWVRWPELHPGVGLRSVTVDTEWNRLRVRADTAPRLLDPAFVRAVREDLGVQLRIEFGVKEPSAACREPDECEPPLAAGGVIHRGGASGPRCTIGFHVRTEDRDEFLTSGHCGHGGPEDWYQGAVLVGRQVATLYGQDGMDLMRVRLAGLSASRLLRGQPVVVAAATDPVPGQVVCASLGRSGRIDCGTVSTDWTSWIDGICGCRSWGADVDGIEIFRGDSGSPIYQLNGGGRGATAIGIVSTTSGKFAPVAAALARWEATLAH